MSTPIAQCAEQMCTVVCMYQVFSVQMCVVFRCVCSVQGRGGVNQYIAFINRLIRYESQSAAGGVSFSPTVWVLKNGVLLEG